MMEKPSGWVIAALWAIASLTLANAFVMLFFPSGWFFRLVPGVTETGPFNAHLVQDGGTFNLAVGLGLVAAARRPYRNAIAVVVAAVAAAAHAILHVYAHAAGLLGSEPLHVFVEVVGVLAPAVLLALITVILIRGALNAESGSTAA